MTLSRFAKTSLAAAGLAAGLALSSGGVLAGQGQVIELTQTACQFLEPEGGTDHGFKTSQKADCEAVNAENGAERLTKSETMTLKPGRYTFRVTNRDVPYDLGFWLRGEGLVARATLPSVSGGGLSEGATKDYVIDLKPGDYVFSCPLNPTLDYKIRVEA